jgi:hypothetical protein
MNYAPRIYTAPFWWQVEAMGRFGRPQRQLTGLQHQRLEASFILAEAATRTRSERAIAQLIRESM